MDSPVVISALIAAGAAFVSAIFNIIIARTTIRAGRENIEKTAATSIEVTNRTIRANIVSANRQKWIDGIRDDLASFLSAHTVALSYHSSTGTNAQLAEEARQARREMYLLSNRIRLKLNLNEVSHTAFLGLLEEAREMTTPWDEAEGRLISAAQAIFKAEWERIKRGD